MIGPRGFSPVAAASALGFVLGGLALGETYPFSRFSMYAAVARRTEGAVPVFLADGALVEPERYDRFVGLDPEQIRPIGIPCTLEYRLHDGRGWIGGHLAPAGAPGGPVHFAAGFEILRQRPDGSIEKTRRILTEGSAWPR